jgi:hypothetical protein
MHSAFRVPPIFGMTMCGGVGMTVWALIVYLDPHRGIDPIKKSPNSSFRDFL